MQVILLERGVAGTIVKLIIFSSNVLQHFFKKSFKWVLTAFLLVIFIFLRILIMVKMILFLIRLCNTILKLFHIEWIPQKVVCIVAFHHLLLWSPVVSRLVLSQCMVWHGSVSKQFPAPLLLQVAPLDMVFINSVEIRVISLLHDHFCTFDAQELSEDREPALQLCYRFYRQQSY